MYDAERSATVWIARHTVFVWIGILLNFAFLVPLLVDPVWLLDLFGIQVVHTIWPRFAGLLLLILSIFYIPSTLDFRRYQSLAWLAVFPSRTFGFVFFLAAVFLFGQPYGFLVAAALDGFVALTTLFCLIRIAELDRRAGIAGGGP